MSLVSSKIPRATLEQWAVLHAIVTHGGYAQAAAALHRSQSSVSYTVRQLQEQVGVPLLVIEGRKARLTEAGAILLHRARQLLDDARRLEELAHSLEHGWEAEIHLVVDLAYPTHLLLQALAQLAEIAPHTRVQLKEVTLSGAEEALFQNSADLVIGGWVPTGFLGEELLRVTFVAVAAPEHPLHQLARDLTEQDLVREQQVVVRDSGTTQPRDAGWLRAERRWTVSSLDTSLQVVLSGLGFAWLPCHLIAPHIAAGRLQTLPLCAGQTRHASMHLIYAQPELAGPVTRRLGELIRGAAAGWGGEAK